jgi:quinol monooxygenase YgiN
MITITAVIRVRPGTESIMHEALHRVADNVRRNEPNTIDFFVSVGIAEPNVFTTYERFVDRTAMDAHNASPVVKQLHKEALPILEQPIVLEIGDELFTTKRSPENEVPK